jgi:pyochelin biosynthesis protein PchC
VTHCAPGRSGAWLRAYRPSPAAGIQIVCFPHAGGSARFFRTWFDHLPPTVGLLAVQYPGRDDRINEEFASHVGLLAGQIVRALDQVTGPRLALFGHSLGAVVAYEVARRLEAGSASGPAALFVSGRPGPSHQREQNLHLADDEALWADVRRLRGTPDPLLDNPELRHLLAPALRADYRLSETYRPVAGPLLRCPVIACLGSSDPEVTPTEASSWSEVTRGAFSLRVFSGDHFYLLPRAAEVTAMMLSQLAAHAVSPVWPSAP